MTGSASIAPETIAARTYSKAQFKTVWPKSCGPSVMTSSQNHVEAGKPHNRTPKARHTGKRASAAA
jgi:hypothetical protein